MTAGALRIWIDLENTPHVLFFEPVIAALRERGHHVAVTARRFGNTLELARARGCAAQHVGGGYDSGRNRTIKMLFYHLRCAQLQRFARVQRFDVAANHHSRSQSTVAARLGIPTWSTLDYEHADMGALRDVRCLMVPELLAREALAPIGVAQDLLRPYAGLKEDVYLHEFRPSIDARRLLGIGDAELLVVFRPSAEHAHYGNALGPELDRRLLQHLRTQRGLRIVVLPRTARQRGEWAALANGDGSVIVAAQVLDGPSLIYAADLVVCGGGTMVREAAVLGVPAISCFTGPVGAVDAALARERRIRVVRSAADVAGLEPVTRHRRRAPRVNGAPLRQIVDAICATAG